MSAISVSRAGGAIGVEFIFVERAVAWCPVLVVRTENAPISFERWAESFRVSPSSQAASCASSSSARSHRTAMEMRASAGFSAYSAFLVVPSALPPRHTPTRRAPLEVGFPQQPRSWCSLSRSAGSPSRRGPRSPASARPRLGRQSGASFAKVHGDLCEVT
jgi:hypothetical protein